VLARDGYRCRRCGATAALHAHHDWAWSAFPALRFDVTNGMTLCVDCHKAHHQEQRATRAARRLTLDAEILEWNTQERILAAYGGAWYDGEWPDLWQSP
jgi:5-methylcytosine-specific restriction endonuclease McrA